MECVAWSGAGLGDADERDREDRRARGRRGIDGSMSSKVGGSCDVES